MSALNDILGYDYVIVEHHALVGVSHQCHHCDARSQFDDLDFMIQLYSCLFAKRFVGSRIRDLAVTQVKTGFDNTYGNKVIGGIRTVPSSRNSGLTPFKIYSQGSILIRLVLDNTSICFLNSHLAAGDTHPEERERDIIEILEQKSQFPLVEDNTSLLALVNGGDGRNVADHELAFFCGESGGSPLDERDVQLAEVD